MKELQEEEVDIGLGIAATVTTTVTTTLAAGKTTIVTCGLDEKHNITYHQNQKNMSEMKKQILNKMNDFFK